LQVGYHRYPPPTTTTSLSSGAAQKNEMSCFSPRSTCANASVLHSRRPAPRHCRARAVAPERGIRRSWRRGRGTADPAVRAATTVRLGGGGQRGQQPPPPRGGAGPTLAPRWNPRGHAAGEGGHRPRLPGRDSLEAGRRRPERRVPEPAPQGPSVAAGRRPEGAPQGP